MKKIKRIEMGAEIHRTDYKPQYATYRIVTVYYYRADQYRAIDSDRDSGCLYPTGFYDDAGGDMLVGVDEKIKDNIIYTAPVGVVYQCPDPEKTDEEWAQIEQRQYVAEAARRAQDKRNGLCPRCGTYCYGDCEAN